MSRLPSFFASPPPSVGVELASDRVTAVSIGRQGSSNTVAGYAVEGLSRGVLTPALNAPNIHDEGAIVAALRSALEKLGSRQRRVALVIPDSAAKVSLLRFERVPAQSDLDQLIRWQMRKAAPFKPEDAEISWVPAGLLPQGGQEFLVTLARRDVIEGYQRVCAAAGVQAGIVDLASLNLINAVLAGSGESAAGGDRSIDSASPQATSRGDLLVVHVTPDYATLAIVRGKDLIFFRTRHLETYSDLTDLVHQTAMYHEDRLAGGQFGRVLLSGAAARGADAGELARRGLEERLGVRVEALDFRSGAHMVDRISAGTELLDALAPAVGVVLRERVA
jgi:type IV pilus assembly protein PilM